MKRTNPSFVSVGTARFAPSEIEVRWHESEQHGSTYVLDLGRDVSVHLRPEDAPDVVAKLTEAMVARGDLVDYQAIATEAISALEALAHDTNWGQPDSLERLRGVLGHLSYLASDRTAQAVADDAAREAAIAAEKRRWRTDGRSARAVRA